MSDPTARRGDAITSMLDAMKKSGKGWTKSQMKRYLFRAYRYGVTEQTLDHIIAQLRDHGVIYANPIKKGANIYLWYVLDGVYPDVEPSQPSVAFNIDVGKNEEERKRKKERKKPKQRKKQKNQDGGEEK